MSDPALILDGIVKTYRGGTAGPVEVLRGASLELARGEVVALVAPSGAGKSTLLHIAGLLDTADQGQVVIDGLDMTRMGDAPRTAARRQQVGFIYQFHHLLPEFTAAENIVLPQLANGVSRSEAQARAEALLQKVGLSPRGGHRPAQLSGGEQQRVAFCRAMANQPRILLADEPTGNLDDHTAESIRGLLFELNREAGTTLVLVTHDMEFAARCDRVLRLHDGQLRAATPAAAAPTDAFPV